MRRPGQCALVRSTRDMSLIELIQPAMCGVLSAAWGSHRSARPSRAMSVQRRSRGRAQHRLARGQQRARVLQLACKRREAWLGVKDSIPFCGVQAREWYGAHTKL